MIMSPRSHVQYFFRGIYQWTVAACRQLPPRYNVRIDSQKFLEALQAVIDGEVVTADKWALGPDGNIHSPDADAAEKRQEIRKTFLVDMHERYAECIPTAQNESPFREQFDSPCNAASSGRPALKRKAPDSGDHSERAPKSMFWTWS